MMKTVVFGGTFDPPHEGHRHLLQSVMEHGYDRAVVIPVKIPPHKVRDTQEDDFCRRFELAKEMFSDMENVTVSDLENRRTGKSYTVDTLRILNDKYPDDRLYLLVGSDMLLSIEKWRCFEEIFRRATIISAARTASDILKIHEYKDYLEKKYNCSIIIYDIDVIELSSSQLRSPLIRKIDAHNRQHLSPDRYAHVSRVADYALELAAIHGLDSYKAYVAALVHDCTKFMDDRAQLDYFEKNKIALTKSELETPKIYHQISGAHFARESFGIEDEDILNAVRYHTTGREKMSKLEKLVCLADSIEPGRDFPGVDKMRQTARTSLDRALLMSFDRLIGFIKERGLNMNEQTLKARDYLRKELTMTQTEQILDTAVKTIYKKKGREIQILRVEDITVMADYFIICTGMSNTQIKALAGDVEFELSKLGIEPLHTEGYGNSTWVLLDYGSVIIHIFYKDAREYYKLERLWADAKELPLSDFIKDEGDKTDEI